MHTGQITRGAALGLALALAAVGCGESGGGVATQGAVAPSFTLTTQTGETLDSDSLTGQVVVLNFWSTTCGPCLRELPHLQAVHGSGRARVIGVAVDPGGWGAVRPVLAQHHVEFPVALGDEALFERFDGYGIPHTLLLDRSRRVIKVYRGAVSREQLERDIAGVASAG